MKPTLATRRSLGLFNTALFALTALVLAGCSGDAAYEADSESSQAVVSGLPVIADFTEGTWNTVDVEDGTTCSDGSDFAFFARRANPEKLLVYFQGGGGCWTGATCDTGRVGSYKVDMANDDPAKGNGIFALDHPENPFADYSMVFVPYCTGDVHLGDQTKTYDVAALPEGAEVKEGADPAAHQVTIEHRGHKNGMTALEWAFANFSPETVFVTGSSAGSIPSPYYAAHVKEQWPAARVEQLGDGSGGYRRLSDSTPWEPWGTLDAIDSEPHFQGIDGETMSWEALYIAAAKAHPDVSFAAFDNAEDAVQLRFLALGGQEAPSLLPLLDANQNDIRTAVPNFKSFVAGGGEHTILGRPEFYTLEADGVSIRDWVAALAAGEEVDDVHCLACADAVYREVASETPSGAGG